MPCMFALNDVIYCIKGEKGKKKGKKSKLLQQIRREIRQERQKKHTPATQKYVSSIIFFFLENYWSILLFHVFINESNEAEKQKKTHFLVELVEYIW